MARPTCPVPFRFEERVHRSSFGPQRRRPSQWLERLGNPAFVKTALRLGRCGHLERGADFLCLASNVRHSRPGDAIVVFWPRVRCSARSPHC